LGDRKLGLFRREHVVLIGKCKRDSLSIVGVLR